MQAGYIRKNVRASGAGVTYRAVTAADRINQSGSEVSHAAFIHPEQPAPNPHC